MGKLKTIKENNLKNSEETTKHSALDFKKKLEAKIKRKIIREMNSKTEEDHNYRAKLDKYEQWQYDGVLKEKLILIRGLAMNNIGIVEASKELGINSETFIKLCKNYDDFNQAWKLNKRIASFQVENALFKKAMSGDNMAMIFFLKNNYSEKYNDLYIPSNVKPVTIIDDLPKPKLELVAIRTENEQNSNSNSKTENNIKQAEIINEQ